MRSSAARSVQVRAAVAHAEQVAQRVGDVHAHQRRLGAVEPAARQRQMHFHG